MNLETLPQLTELQIWQLIAGALSLLVLAFNGSACYWRARAQSLKELDESGWVNEAKFWRRHFDKDSAEWVEDYLT